MSGLALILVLLLLAGCTAAFDVAGHEWEKPGVGLPQVTLDQTECARDAYEAGDTPDLLLGGLLDAIRLAVENSAQAGAYADCMTARGYERREG